MYGVIRKSYQFTVFAGLTVSYGNILLGLETNVSA